MIEDLDVWSVTVEQFGRQGHGNRDTGAYAQAVTDNPRRKSKRTAFVVVGAASCPFVSGRGRRARGPGANGHSRFVAVRIDGQVNSACHEIHATTAKFYANTHGYTAGDGSVRGTRGGASRGHATDSVRHSSSADRRPADRSGAGRCSPQSSSTGPDVPA